MRDPQIYLDDILEAIENIHEDTKSLTEKEFSEKRIVQQATVRNLEIIGEAVQRLPKDIRDKYPTIPWRKIVGLRNRIVHEYFGLKLNVIWTTIQKSLPQFEEQVRLIIKDYELKENN